jgi:serine/threonine-protein kinase
MSEPTAPRIGPYEVLHEIGRGGMGVVHLARDTKLDREVAIKCLPDDLADDAERLARFEREAKTLASLNHTNIASIYGLEEVDGQRYLILEYVPGETLDEVLDHGPMPVSEALPIARQIAEAIECAHEHGVIHRDLKPANIKFAGGDQVKVLDFGLAKAFEENPTMASDIAASPTYIPTNTPTMPGAVLGTAGYLSPEQARGRSVDKRTDIFSFGCVLYEMLAGRTIFPGETVADSLGATLHKEPAWDDLPEDTPPTILLLLRRCLAKDRKRRLHDIADARVEIEDAIGDPTSSSLNLAGAALVAGGAPSSRRSSLLGVFALGVVLAAGGTFGLMRALSPDPAPPFPHHLTVAIPEEQGFNAWPWFRPMSISRDGRQLVFTGQSDTSQRFSELYRRPLDQPEATVIPGTENAIAPCFSPDGESIAFAARGAIRRISTRGGPPSTICPTERFVPALDWGADGTIVFSAYGRSGAGLMRVPAAGGTPQPITSVEPDSDTLHALPHVLPDGSGVIFTALERDGEWDDAVIMALRYDGGEPRELLRGGADARYVASGHLLYRRQNTLMAVPFDLDRLERTGEPVPVLEQVSGMAKELPGHFDVSGNGTLVYVPGTGTDMAMQGVVRIDAAGTIEPLSTNEERYEQAVLSPDGSRVALVVGDEDDSDRADIHILELRRDLVRPLVAGPDADRNPVWSPDLRWIVFSSDRHGGESSIYRVPADFSGEPERLTTSEDWQRPTHFSPDGRTLAIETYSSDDEVSRIFLLPFDEAGAVAGEPVALGGQAGHQYEGRLSPDGKWIAYRANAAGQRARIFVRRADGAGAAVQVSIERGFHPRWAPAGDRLYFSSTWAVHELLAVSFSDEDGAFEPELPEAVFDVGLGRRLGSGYEITPDGQRFVTTAPADLEDGSDPLNPRVILNWLDHLGSAVPGRGGE